MTVCHGGCRTLRVAYGKSRVCPHHDMGRGQRGLTSSLWTSASVHVGGLARIAVALRKQSASDSSLSHRRCLPRGADSLVRWHCQIS
jgi:hypothetical protein